MCQVILPQSRKMEWIDHTHQHFCRQWRGLLFLAKKIIRLTAKYRTTADTLLTHVYVHMPAGFHYENVSEVFYAAQFSCNHYDISFYTYVFEFTSHLKWARNSKYHVSLTLLLTFRKNHYINRHKEKRSYIFAYHTKTIC